MKATAEEKLFHQRLLGREDPVAFAELAEAFYADVVRKTRARAGSAADPALVEEAVGKAFLDYHNHLERYNPELSSLCDYLVMAAYRDFQTVRQRENQRSKWQVLHSDMAHIADDNVAAVDGAEQSLNRLHAAEVWPHVSAAFTDPIEREVLTLIIEGVRDTSAYATILGIRQLSEDEQMHHVNRVKNRIKKRLRRIGEKFDE